MPRKESEMVLNEKTGAYNGKLNGWDVTYLPPGKPIELSGGKKGKSNKEVYGFLSLKHYFPDAKDPNDITEIFCSRSDGSWYVIKHFVDEMKNQHPDSFVCNTKHNKQISEELALLGLNITFPSDAEINSLIAPCS